MKSTILTAAYFICLAINESFWVTDKRFWPYFVLVILVGFGEVVNKIRKEK